MTAILADVNIQGHVALLVRRMRAEPWQEFWEELRLAALTFDDVGLPHHASDLEVWQLCQQRDLILVTNNRNHEGEESLEAVIRSRNSADWLPVLTVSDAERIRQSREYAEQVIESLLDALTRLDDLRGTGRLYLPW